MIDLELICSGVKLDELPKQTPTSSPMGSRDDLFLQVGNVQDCNTIASEAANLERDIVRKGIEWLEKPIS